MKAAIAILLLIAAACAFVAISGIQRISTSGGSTEITYYTPAGRIAAALVGVAALFAAYGCFRKHPLFLRHAGTRTFQPLGITRRHDLTDLPLASFARRFVAFGIDFFFVIILVAVASLRETPAGSLEDQNYDLHLDPFHGWALLILLAYFGLGTFLGKGRTPGKRILRIRVLSLAHDHLTLWHSIERALGYGASMLEAGFGFLQYFSHPNCQTVHDRIAETIVVFEAAAKSQPNRAPQRNAGAGPAISDEAPAPRRGAPSEEPIHPDSPRD